MKRSLLALGILGSSLSVFADPSFQPLGENLTYGTAGNHQTMSAYGNNPAVGASSLGVEDEWYFGMGVISSVGIGLEVGPVDNFNEDIDDFSTQINAISEIDSSDFTAILDAVTDLKTSFDPFLIKAGDAGYFQASLAVRPLFPIVWTSKGTIGGSLVFDGNLGVQAKLRVLDAPIIIPDLTSFISGSTDGLDIDQLAKDITNTHLYLKVGAVGEFSLGYSRPVLELPEGTLTAGIRGKVYQVNLKKILVPVTEVTDAEQLVRDEVDLSVTADTGFGADLGVLWTSKNYRLGAWFKNMNSPSFDYDPVSQDCDAIADEAAKTRCYKAKAFANEVDLEESYTMDAQVNLEGAVYSDSRNFVLSASFDTSPVNDAVANELQWATVSAGYATRSWIIPGIRAGYRKNLAGSQLSAVTGGVTLFKLLHADVAYGLEKVTVSGQSAPRMLQFNLGIDFLF